MAKDHTLSYDASPLHLSNIIVNAFHTAIFTEVCNKRVDESRCLCWLLKDSVYLSYE